MIPFHNKWDAGPRIICRKLGETARCYLSFRLVVTPRMKKNARESDYTSMELFHTYTSPINLNECHSQYLLFSHFRSLWYLGIPFLEDSVVLGFIA